MPVDVQNLKSVFKSSYLHNNALKVLLQMFSSYKTHSSLSIIKKGNGCRGKVWESPKILLQGAAAK